MAITSKAGSPPTITDVAEKAGVSMKTVSRVMNQEAAMHPQTREQLLSGVADLKYRPKLSACILAGARSLVFDWAALLRSDCIHVHPDLSNVLAFDATDRLCV